MRIRLCLTALFLLAMLAGATPARAANDPSLVWKTLRTKHFRITYYSGEADIAQHVADLAESIHARLAPAVGWSPSEVTEIVLTDVTDSANGSAGALPYNQVHLYVTAPDDLSPLGDVDDWYLELLTHEYTHVLHTDHIVGVPALINAILGKTLAPNQLQPHWMLEGLAVFEESSKTSGGRLRSSQWNMYMRADVLENNVATLDQFSNTPRRWPQGNLWYLYGSFFMRWIAETYGEQAIRAMIDDYGSQLIPYGVNRSVRRATGRTLEELYPAWVESLRRSFGEQAAAIRARGLREGVRLTTTSQNAQKPRFIPENAWPGHGGELLYWVDDGHTTGGLYRVPLVRDAQGRVIGSREKERELMVRTSGSASASFEPNGNVVFNMNDVWKNLYFYNDLFEMPAGKRSETGLEGGRTRLTYGMRSIDPDVSPDGRRVVFVSNHRGTQTLRIANLTPQGIDSPRVLVPSAAFDQAFAPRWSPDNRHVAYSAWTRGGYRDVRIVDTIDGTFVNVTHDRAIDGGPSFSRDGKWLFFHSDRTGVMNVFAYELATGNVRQVTNVMNGAYQPEPSPDGKNLLYLGYTHAGFDIFSLPLDEARWLDAPAYAESRPPPPPGAPHLGVKPQDYNPLLTLRPRHYSVQITQGNYGEASILSTGGGDIAGLHAFSASITTEWERPEFQGDLAYAYTRLPVDLTAHAFRHIQPRGGYQLGPDFKPTWVEETAGFDTGVAYAMPRAFDGQSFALNYSVTHIGGELPLPIDRLNPYDTPAVPTRGLLSSLHLGWSYSNAQGYLWSIGNERGFALGADIDVSDPAIASDFSGYAATLNFETYHLMPWGRHHALALHAGGGAAGGNFGGRGAFYVGGFIDEPFIDTVRNYLIQGGIQLRGYPVVAEVGRNYALFNAEYRFPILNVDRGPSTLPMFLQRISGAAFVDYGSAFDAAETAKFKTGIGGELWFDLTFGYVENFTFRAGYAKGLASSGIDKLYFLAAIPF